MGQVANKSALEADKKNKRAALLIILCWLVYTCSYIGKLGYNANITQIETLFGVTHVEAGMVSTFFFFAYGVGQIINGILCKKYNVRYVVFGSLILSGIMNLLVGFVHSFEALKYFWLINGAALSVLWTSLIRLLSEELEEKYMGRAVIVMGTTVATGTFLVYGMSALFVALRHFQTIFYLAGLLLPLIAVVWMVSYPFLTKKQAVSEVCQEKETTCVEGSSKTLKGLWIIFIILAFYAVVNNLVKDGLTTWVPMILKDLYHLPDYISILLTIFLPILAIFGTAVSVWLHKKIKNFVALCMVLFLCTGILIGLVIVFLPQEVFIITLISFALVSCLMSGVNNVVTSMVPLYWKDKINSGMVAGILNGFCYVGSTVSSYGLGAVADAWDWSAVFWLLFGLACAATLIGFGYNIVILIKKRGNAGKLQ